MRLIRAIMVAGIFVGCGPNDTGGGGNGNDDDCQANADCSDGFCGWRADNSRVCKPWAQSGDSCEGFVLPEARAFCEPSLICVQSEPTGDIPGVCQATCTDDSQCAPDGWCGYLADGSRVCKDYAAPGETCGGFVQPEYLEICGPGYHCYNDQPNIPDLPGTCTTICQDSGDCSSDTFCAPDQSGTRVCKDRASLGESCGGFTLPSHYFICEQGLSCLSNPQIADDIGTCQQSCSTNADCANFDGTGGFCGFDQYQQRICKHWGQAGDYCGGFVRPQDVVFCEPSLTCVPQDPNIPDLPGICQ